MLEENMLVANILKESSSFIKEDNMCQKILGGENGKIQSSFQEEVERSNEFLAGIMGESFFNIQANKNKGFVHSAKQQVKDLKVPVQKKAAGEIPVVKEDDDKMPEGYSMVGMQLFKNNPGGSTHITTKNAETPYEVEHAVERYISDVMSADKLPTEAPKHFSPAAKSYYERKHGKPVVKEGYQGPGCRDKKYKIYIDGEYFMKTDCPDSVIDLQIKPEWNVDDVEWDDDAGKVMVTTKPDVEESFTPRQKKVMECINKMMKRSSLLAESKLSVEQRKAAYFISERIVPVMATLLEDFEDDFGAGTPHSEEPKVEIGMPKDAEGNEGEDNEDEHEDNEEEASDKLHTIVQALRTIADKVMEPALKDEISGYADEIENDVLPSYDDEDEDEGSEDEEIKEPEVKEPELGM
jgi:hypothetical protein